jgi:hypothetical protein
MVAQLAGHSVTSTTESVYRRQITEAAMPGAEILGDVLRPLRRVVRKANPAAQANHWGHLRVSCRTPGCGSMWYKPRHDVRGWLSDHNEQMPSTTTEDPAMPTLAWVATFFVAYPEVIGLPDGSYFCLAMDTPVRGFPGKIALHLKEGEAPARLAPELADSLVVSVRFHRWKRDRNIIADAYAQVMPVVRAVGGPSFPPLEGGSDGRMIEDELDGDESDRWSSRTVLEMTTQLVSPQDSYFAASAPDPSVMGPTLTRCIDATVRVINAYRFGEKLTMRAPA